MELDAKQQVLMAIYTEYQKDVPQMYVNVNPDSLQIDPQVFTIAVEKLLNEGLITDASVHRAVAGFVAMPIMDNCKMTRYGIEYVETKAGLNPTDNAEEKIKSLRQTFTEWGIERLENVAAKWLAEMTKGP